jgi:hypothetical protein
MCCSYLITVALSSGNETHTCNVSSKKGKLPAEVISKYCKGDYENCQRFMYRSRLME